MIELVGKGLCKAYGRRSVVRSVSVLATSGDCIGIVGHNGSGKSTLLKMLGGLLRPDSGTVSLSVNGTTQPSPLPHTGFVAPWLHIYEEFTITEMMELQVRMHGERPLPEKIAATLARLQLEQRANNLVRELSSGLRQRVLLALAVHRQPPLLMLDEPSTTLDEAGKQLVRAEIEQHRLLGGVVILATNDAEEASWCTSTVSMTT